MQLYTEVDHSLWLALFLRSVSLQALLGRQRDHEDKDTALFYLKQIALGNALNSISALQDVVLTKNDYKW